MLIHKLHRLLLPSVSVADRAKLPPCPGCYYVTRGLRILYIGRAETSIKSRWRRHHKTPKLRASDRIHYWVMYAVLVRDREAQDIDNFRPPLNGRMEPRDWRGRVAAMVIDLGCLVAGAVLARVMWLVLMG